MSKIPNRREAALWGLLLGALVYEAREIRERDAGTPLSAVLRALWRTHHPVGAAAFCLSVDVGAEWLKRHICSTSG